MPSLSAQVVTKQTFDTHDATPALNTSGKLYDFIAGQAPGSLVAMAAMDSAVNSWTPSLLMVQALQLVGSAIAPRLKRR